MTAGRIRPNVRRRWTILAAVAGFAFGWNAMSHGPAAGPSLDTRAAVQPEALAAVATPAIPAGPAEPACDPDAARMQHTFIALVDQVLASSGRTPADLRSALEAEQALVAQVAAAAGIDPAGMEAGIPFDSASC